MDDYQVKTPEQVDIGYTVAGLGTRFMALAIDTLIQTAALIAMFVLLVATDWLDTFAGWYVALIVILIAIILGGYHLLFELFLKGKTPGKAALKIRVIRVDGAAADVSGIVIRNLIRLIDFLPLLYSVGIITMFISKDSRRLGDLAGGTVVVKMAKKVSLNSILAEKIEPAYASVEKHRLYFDIENTLTLTNQEYAVIRNFFARRDKLTIAARNKLAWILATPLFDKAGIAEHQRHDPEDFLTKLIQE
jgi:uncharacterized RDD family membrane protein YckC